MAWQEASGTSCESVTTALCLTWSSFPCSFTMTGCTPKKGRDADPGLASTAPGRGVITAAGRYRRAAKVLFRATHSVMQL